MKNWNVRKAIVAREDMPEHHRLTQSLSWPHLIALGVGAIVGTGILTLIGVGAGKAGPAVILSFAIAGAICACAALAYAEVATMIPASGSAYTYSYVVFGELVAWMVGVALILEYSLVVSAVAVGWSGYAAGFLQSVGMGLPLRPCAGPGGGRYRQSSGDLHHRCHRRTADRRNARKRDLERDPGGGETGRFGDVHRGRTAGVQRRQFHAVHAARFPAQRAVGERGRRDGGGGDHLLRFLRVRRDRDGGRGGQESRPRSCHRNRRVDAALRADLHGRRRGRDRRACPIRGSPIRPSRWR